MGALQEENGEFWSSHSRRQWVSYEETKALKPMLEVLILKNQGWVGFRDGFGVLVKKWRVFYGGRRRKSWKWKAWAVLNSDGRGYGMKLLRWAAMVGLRMGDDEGEDLVDGKKWSEKRWWEDWRRTSLEFKKRNWLLKNKCEFLIRWIVKCEIFAFLWFSKIESMLFFGKWS